jgi:hypothetical protein
MLPFLVSDLICIMVVTVCVIISGIFATVSYWERGLVALIVGSVCMCKYYFKNCVINILFLFVNLSCME